MDYQAVECSVCGGPLEEKWGYPTVGLQVWPKEKNIEADKIRYFHCNHCKIDYLDMDAVKVIADKIKEIGGYKDDEIIP
jgi:hypothetical protein